MIRSISFIKFGSDSSELKLMNQGVRGVEYLATLVLYYLLSENDSLLYSDFNANPTPLLQADTEDLRSRIAEIEDYIIQLQKDSELNDDELLESLELIGVEEQNGVRYIRIRVVSVSGASQEVLIG